MARQTRSFWVGIFVLAGLVIGIGGVLWLGASNWFKPRKLYVTYFDSSVQGLNVDADVKFRGVDVGKVKGARVAPDGVLVEVTMQLEPAFKVAPNMRTRLSYSGITGLKFIEMDYAEGDKLARHPKFSFEPPHPVIPSQPGGFADIEESLKAVYAKLVALDTEGISWRAAEFLEKGSRTMATADSLLRSMELAHFVERMGRAADRVDTLLAALDTRRYDAQVDTALANMIDGSRRFHRMMANLEVESGRLRVAERTDSVMRHLDDLVASGQDLVSTSKELVTRSQYSTAQVMINLRTTMNEMNSAVEQLNALMISMESYPSNILWAAPPKKEE